MLRKRKYHPIKDRQGGYRPSKDYNTKLAGNLGKGYDRLKMFFLLLFETFLFLFLCVKDWSKQMRRHRDIVTLAYLRFTQSCSSSLSLPIHQIIHYEKSGRVDSMLSSKNWRQNNVYEPHDTPSHCFTGLDSYQTNKNVHNSKGKANEWNLEWKKKLCTHKKRVNARRQWFRGPWISKWEWNCWLGRIVGYLFTVSFLYSLFFSRQVSSVSHSVSWWFGWSACSHHHVPRRVLNKHSLLHAMSCWIVFFSFCAFLLFWLNSVLSSTIQTTTPFLVALQFNQHFICFLVIYCLFFSTSLPTTCFSFSLQFLLSL